VADRRNDLPVGRHDLGHAAVRQQRNVVDGSEHSAADIFEQGSGPPETVEAEIADRERIVTWPLPDDVDARANPYGARVLERLPKSREKLLQSLLSAEQQRMTMPRLRRSHPGFRAGRQTVAIEDGHVLKM
jgi:hypothetical protein